MKNFLSLIFILLFFPNLSYGKIPSTNTDHANIEILAESKEIKIGENFVFGIKFDLAPGWHTYWKNPGDSGLPPDIKWTTPQGISEAKMLWPAPGRAEVEPLMSYGFYDQLVLPIIFNVDESFVSGQDFIIEIDFLICEIICIPESAKLSFNINEFDDDDISTSRELLSKWYKKLPSDDNFDLDIEASKDLFSLSWQRNNEKISTAYFYPEENGLIKYSAPQLYFEDGEKSKIVIERPVRNKNLESVSGVIEIVSNNGVTFSNISSPIRYVSKVESPNNSSLSFLVAIILAFLGGIILNIMPCVFPVIALKVMTFIKEAGEGGAWKHGLAFSLGVELSMLILLSATFIFRSLGQAVGWGWQLQSSSVSSLLSILFFAIAFILLFKVEFGSSLTRLGGIGSKTTGYLNSLLLGCLTVIVATPCTGPFMGAAIGWGLSQSFFVSLMIFLSLGLGVAFPTLILSVIPSGLNFLPKPGVWMVRVGQLMSIPMALTAIWLAWVVQRQAGFSGLRDLFIGLLFILISLTIYKISIKNKVYKFISIFFIILGPLFIILSNNDNKVLSKRELEVGEPWSAEILNNYKDTHKNILINFTADWCLTCKVNEAMVFRSDSFKKLIDDGELIYLVADWTNYDPLITKELERYKRGGVPLYLYWKIGEENPRILPAILTNKIFYDGIR